MHQLKYDDKSSCSTRNPPKHSRETSSEREQTQKLQKITQLEDVNKPITEITVVTQHDEIIAKKRIEKHFSQFGRIKKIEGHRYDSKFLIEFCQQIVIKAKQCLKSDDSEEDTAILKLNDDILGKIFKQLLPHDIWNLVNTCKRFHRVIYQDHLNFILLDANLLNKMNHSELCAGYIERFVTNYDNIDEAENLNLINRYFSKVEKICITEKPILRLKLLIDLKSITTLKLVRCGLKNDDISLLQKFRKLEILDISHNIELTGAYISDLRTIKKLSLAGCQRVAASNFVEIFKWLSNLRALNLMDCDLLSNYALNIMLGYCGSLEDIVITWNTEQFFFLSLAFLPKLKKLKVCIQAINEFTSSFIRKLVIMKTLESFEVWVKPLGPLSGYQEQSGIFLEIANLTQLKRLIISGRRSVNQRFDSGSFRQLRKLTNLEYIGICGEIEESDLLILLKECTKLNSITVKNPGPSINTRTVFKMIDLLKKLRTRRNPVVFSAYNSAMDPLVLKDPKYLASKSVLSVILDERAIEVFVHKNRADVEHFTSEVPIFKLNNDCLRLILLELPTWERNNFGKVCNRFYDISKDQLYVHLVQTNDSILRRLQENKRRVKSLRCGYGVKFADDFCLPKVNDIFIEENRNLLLNLHKIMENLKALVLVQCELKDEDVLEIKKLPALNYLYLRWNKDLTGKHLCELKNIKKLRLRDCVGITSEHFVNIYKSLKKLKHLTIVDCPKLNDNVFQEIDGHCEQLVSLKLNIIKDVEYSWIARLDKLKTLKISYCDNNNQLEETLDKLSMSRKLKVLNVGGIEITKRCANSISKLTYLKRCVVGSYGQENYWIQTLKTLKNLEKIDLGRLSDRVSENELLQLLRECNKLKLIILKSCELTEKFLFDAIDLLMKRQKVWVEPILIRTGSISKQILTHPKIIEAELNHVMILSECQT